MYKNILLTGFYSTTESKIYQAFFIGFDKKFSFSIKKFYLCGLVQHTIGREVISMQVSALIGKPVLSGSGERLGYVTALYFARDFSRISCLICADAEEEEFILPARALLADGDAVIVGRQRLSEPVGVPSPIGRTVYSHTGEQLGVVADIRTGDAPELVLHGPQKEECFPLSIAAVGETVILYPSEKERRAAGSPTGRNTPERQKRAPAAAKKTPAKEYAPAADESERLCRTDLLGRTVRRSVFDDFGRPIAKAGEKVTAEMIGRARRSNRLLTLSMNTLTNFDILT